MPKSRPHAQLTSQTLSWPHTMPFHPFSAISRTICSAVLAGRRRRRLRKNYEKRCLICANSTCSINILNTNTGLKPSHFIRSQPFQTTSTQRRGAALTMRTAAKSWKKLLNWGKPQSLSIFNKKSDRRNRWDCRGRAAEKDAKTFSARNTNCN